MHYKSTKKQTEMLTVAGERVDHCLWTVYPAAEKNSSLDNVSVVI